MFPQDKDFCKDTEYRYSEDLWSEPKWKFLTLSGILNDSIYVSLSFTKRNPHEAMQHVGYMKKKNSSENNRVETSKLEVLSNQIKQNSWPLEKSVFESLPPRLRKGMFFRLFCNFKWQTLISQLAPLPYCYLIICIRCFLFNLIIPYETRD